MEPSFRSNPRLTEVKGSPRNHHDDSMTNLMAENTLRVSDGDTAKVKMRKMGTSNVKRMSTKISGANQTPNGDSDNVMIRRVSKYLNIKLTNSKMNFEESISFTKLVRHIQNWHPTKIVKGSDNLTSVDTFNICEDIGSLPMSNCCRSKTTDMAKQIGIGPSIFLMTTKALSWFFFLMTILNIPVFIFYYAGNVDAKSGASSDSYFVKMSLGNIGSNSFSCENLNFVNLKKNIEKGRNVDVKRE